MIRLDNVSKFYYSNGTVATGFSHVSCTFRKGEFVVITGESGSGKSTLLNVIGGLDVYDEGEMYVNGKETSHYSKDDLENYRKQYIASIFQNYNLINSYTVFQNVEMMLLISGNTKKTAAEKADDLIRKVGLWEFRDKKASKLSGGQKQRVAIARALAKETDVILADEPTANLDSENAAEVIRILSRAAEDRLIIVVTHNSSQFEEYQTRRIRMNDGMITEDTGASDTEDAGEISAQPEDDEEIAEEKNISDGQCFRIGMRNTINLPSKFILLMMVMLFLVFSVAGEYGSMKRNRELNSSNGYNPSFSYSPERIIVKTGDGKALSEGDIRELESTEGVNRVIADDVINEQAWYSSGDYLGEMHLRGTDSSLKKNEVILYVNPECYFVDGKDGMKELKGTEFGIDTLSPLAEFRIAEVAEDRSLNEYESEITVSDEIYQLMRIQSTLAYSEVTVGGVMTEQDSVMIYADSSVKPGSAVSSEVPEGSGFTISLKNGYREKEMNLVNSGLAEKYRGTAGTFVNPEDLETLIGRESYQAGVFADDEEAAAEVSAALSRKGYETFALDGTQTTDTLGEVVSSVAVVPVITFLIIAVFFICYFVTGLIMRSRKEYYGILRILGMDRKKVRKVLQWELLSDGNLAYLIFIGVCVLVRNIEGMPEMLRNITAVLEPADYLIILAGLNIMLYLVALRTASSMFRKSAMEQMREEV